MQSIVKQPRFKSVQSSVLQPSGHINVKSAAELQQQFADVVSSQDTSALLVDMSLVESIDSAGLMAFVSTLSLAQRLGKQFSLFGVSPSIRIVFELTQLDRVLDILEPSGLDRVAA